ncbi:MAG: ATP-binding protein [Alphaproteobacteria bacterium]|nr:ATP-binding protein [Alphaproteobacteria bacterium]
MLIDFAITNYKSIKKTVHLNMVYNTGESNEQLDKKYNKTNYIDFIKASTGKDEGRINVCPVMALFGANASGKSNILKAFLAIRAIVLNGSVENFYTPFLFSNSTENAPTKFAITFSNDDNKDPRIYSYGIEYTARQIKREYLKQIGKEKDKTIFDTNDFDTILPSIWQLFITRRKPIANIFLDATYDYFNNLDLESQIGLRAVEAFFKGLFIADDINLAPISTRDEKTVKDWLLRMDMRFCEINIDEEKPPEERDSNCNKNEEKSDPFAFDYGGVSEGKHEHLNIYLKDINDQKNILGESYPNHLIIFGFDDAGSPRFNAYNINMKYQKDDSDKTVSINYIKDESTGTKNLFRFLFVLVDALKHGRIIIFDEIDRTIHTELLKFLLGIMHAKNLNKNAQMICSSHNPCIINAAGRYGIMFVEKNSGLSTEVSFLSEYKYSAESVLDDYLNDRFGATPRVIDIFENMEVPDANK